MVMCCPLSGGDGDGPSFYVEEIRRAAKTHQCGECREDIVKGTRYENVKGLWDGSMSTHKTCLSCREIRNHFACSSGFYFERLWDDLEENFFPHMTAGGPCFEGLSVAARLRLFERRLAWFADLSKRQRLQILQTKPHYQKEQRDDETSVSWND
jgi:hypothetical protein